MAVFPPSRRGLSLQVILILLLTTVCVLGAILASREPIGPRFVVYVLAAALTFFPLPFLIYWAYSLTRANYSLDRDNLILTWGLRSEQIPLSDVEWVRPQAAMDVHLPLPTLRMPGAVLGTRRHPGLGRVEFMASDSRSLLVVATAKRVFVISPQDPGGFMEAIQRSIEMGSLSPAAPRSVYLTFTVVQAWESMLARYLWLAGLFLNMGLLAWVSLLIPSLGKIPLGFLPSGAPGDTVPGAGLILLPIVSISFYLVSWVAGLTFYRRPEHRPLAQVLWAVGVFTAVLFLLAVMFIVTAAV